MKIHLNHRGEIQQNLGNDRESLTCLKVSKNGTRIYWEYVLKPTEDGLKCWWAWGWRVRSVQIRCRSVQMSVV